MFRYFIGAIKMTDDELRKLLHPDEESRYLLAKIGLVPAAIIAAIMTLGSFGAMVFVAAFLLISIWFILELIEASLKRNSIQVSDKNFPDINKMVQQVKSDLNYKEKVEIFIIEESSFNLAIMSLFKKKFIILNSETLSESVTEPELRFLIARFVGYLRAKHDRLDLIRILIDSVRKLGVFNLLLNPYERTVIKSGDRIGLAMIDGDIDSALSAMNKLFIGPDLGNQVNPSGIIDQHKSTSDNFFSFLIEIMSSHPSLSLRYSELLNFAEQRFPEQFEKLELRPKYERSFIAPVLDMVDQSGGQVKTAVKRTASP
jgi:Zn-dependent protease with chaperone function